MKKTNLLVLSYTHQGGEWIAITRVLDELKKKLDKKITFTSISFTNGYEERLPYFAKQILIPHAKAKKPLSFIKSLYLDFKHARNAISKIEGDLKNISFVLVTHYLFLPQILNLKFLKRKKFFFYFLGLKSGIIQNLDFRQITTRVIEILSLILSDLIITPSFSAQKHVSTLLGLLSRYKSFFLVPTSVSENFFNKSRKGDIHILRKKFKIKDKTKIVLYSGRLVRYKGLENLIEAFAKFNKVKKDLRLAIAYPEIGKDQRTFKKLKQKVNKKGIKKSVFFIPNLNVRQLISLYHISDVLVLASEIEMAPLVIIEALACKTPCLGTNVGSIPEILSRVEPGLILENNSASEILKKLKFFFSLSRKDLEKVKNNGFTVAKNYSSENSAKKILELIESFDK